MKILITGNKGFIGTRMYALFKKEGFDVIGYDLINGQDIRNKYQLDKFFELNQPTIVIHLAALAGVRQGEEYPDEYISTNITGTKNVIDMCKKYGVDRLISFSSSSIFGDTNMEDGINESCAYNPISVYGVTKVAGEYLVKNSKLKYTIIRPFSVYGENGRHDMVVYKWIDQIKQGKAITMYETGGSYRGYTYVGDLVEVIYKLLDKPYNGVLNIGGNEKIKLSQLYNLFSKHLDNKNIIYKTDRLMRPNSDINESFANCNEAFNHIEYNPKKQFEDIINRILNEEL